MKKIILNIGILLAAVMLIPVMYSQQNPLIYVIKVEGSINPSSADYIHKSIEEAKLKNAECLVIQLNTPGGLLKSTRLG